MSDYIYHLKNGKTMTLSGDTMPSDDEVESIAKENKVELMSPDEYAASTNSPKPESQSIDIPPESFQPKSNPTNTPTKPDESGVLSKLWHTVADPITDLPSRIANAESERETNPSLAMSPTGQGGMHDFAAKVLAQERGFGAGITEGLGNVASSLTSPLNIAMTALGIGEGVAGKAGLSTIAKTLGLAKQAASVPVVAEGGYHTLRPDASLQERASGIAEIAGGVAGLKDTPAEPPINPEDMFGAAPKQPTTPITKPTGKVGMPQPPPEQMGSQGGITYTDKYAKLRQVPVGTKYSMSPNAKMPVTIQEAMNLGFEYKGVNDDGKIVIEKTKESPQVNIPDQEPTTSHHILDALNVPRTIMASEDLSAPLRQGLGLIHKKQFWTALPDMFKAFGDENAAKATMDTIAAKPLFRKTIDAEGNVKPSFAENAGVKLTGLNDMANREESMLSKWAEKIPGIRASNRAYTAFLNKLRADTFEQMVTDFGVFKGEKPDLVTAGKVADFVNAASGRGKLSIQLGRKTFSAEPAANVLSSVLFSPRLMASRLQMMSEGVKAVFSPDVYMMSQPSIRREYLKSLFAVAAVGNTFAQLSKLAGGTVENDPASSDFGKVKFGNTRMDQYGGWQQIIVAAQRLMPQLDLSSQGLGKIGGMMKSTTTGKEYDLTHPKFGQSNRADILSRFIRSKTNPIINFGWGLLAGGKELSGQPMDMTNPNPFQNSIAQRFLPMLHQDIYDLVNDSTTPLPAKVLAGTMATFGMGSQTYTGKFNNKSVHHNQ